MKSLCYVCNVTAQNRFGDRHIKFASVQRTNSVLFPEISSKFAWKSILRNDCDGPPECAWIGDDNEIIIQKASQREHCANKDLADSHVFYSLWLARGANVIGRSHALAKKSRLLTMVAQPPEIQFLCERLADFRPSHKPFLLSASLLPNQSESSVPRSAFTRASVRQCRSIRVQI